MEIEERVIQDCNGFWKAQVRFLPLAEWEPDDGWRTVFISGIRESAEARISKK